MNKIVYIIKTILLYTFTPTKQKLTFHPTRQFLSKIIILPILEVNDAIPLLPFPPRPPPRTKLRLSDYKF